MSSRKRVMVFCGLCVGIALLLVPGSLSAQPIKIGAMFITTGPMGGYGVHGNQAIQMAVDEINAQGGILGRKVEALYEDTKLNKDNAVAIAKRFITKDKVDFLIGPTSSGIAMALMEIAKQHKKILILTQAAADEFTGEKLHPYVFSTLSNAMMHSRSGAYLMASKPYKRYMCIAPDYSYGHSSWNSFKTKLKELRPDVEIVGELFPKFLAKDYSEYIKKLNEVKPDAVWSPLWGAGDAVNFIRQALPTGLFNKVKFAFPVAGALEVLVPMGKDMPQGVYVSSRYFFTSPDSPMNRRFVKTYRERFKDYPDYMAGESYAGVLFIKAAAQRAGSINAGKIIKAVERAPLAWETPEGWKIMRGEDHSVVEDCLWGETVFDEKYGFAMPKTFVSIQAEEICRTDDELKAVRAHMKKKTKKK
ncbi:MAG: ABC transporter substrate-binding protein [Deltaproteobacteria bacterium]|nr:ABC transporter substrate-binding protein [Deltaproteobacteria bacterium]